MISGDWSTVTAAAWAGVLATPMPHTSRLVYSRLPRKPAALLRRRDVMFMTALLSNDATWKGPCADAHVKRWLNPA
ncbi:MAG: hypothetical protein WBG81_16275 [Rhodanobacter sp.]|uniref:hypothetical protein n=1 Tax=Rhodanobacter sp. KK11 TaxID=3083255 RepID=UPI002965FB25|nr:hypothetical protein [Rhodanobacter sp. KK11]MDW2980935.1 hypothetical protein [Rhodanobacter sp. KK11]